MGRRVRLNRSVLVPVGIVLGVVLVGALLLSWFSSGAVINSLDAYDTVGKIYEHCWEGEPDKAARYFLGGPESDLAMRLSICNKITENRTIRGIYKLDEQAVPDGLVLRVRNYRNAETKTDGRIIEWHLVKSRGRWRVVGVV